MKAKCKILYKEGNLCYDKPGTFEVSIIKWSCGARVNYVINVDRVTTNAEGNIPGIYKLSYEQGILSVKSDGEAIRVGTKRFIELDGLAAD